MGHHSAPSLDDVITAPTPSSRRALRESVRGRSARPGAVRRATDRSRTPSRWRRTAAVAAVVLVGAGMVLLSGQRAGAGNAVVNSHLDDGITGWKVNPGATLVSVPGRTGAAARIGHHRDRRWTIALNDVVNTVASTTAGTQYRARVWVRATRAGQRVSLRVMEYRGRAYKGQRLTTLRVRDTDWHELSLTYTAATHGASLDLNVVAHRLAEGTFVDVDDIELRAPSGLPSSTAPANTAPANTAPANTAPANTAPANTAPANTAPANTAPANTAPANTAPANTAPANTAPANTAPANTAPANTAPANTAPANTAPAGWRLVWADEFTGSAVDPEQWRIEHLSTYGDGNSELACLMNRPENLQVSGGVLRLIARRESTPVRCGSADARFPDGRRYTSAHLSTKGKADWTHGRFEVRAKLPTQQGTTKGLWPAFWLRPTAGGTGELDVLEAIGSDGGGSEHTKVHQTIWYDYTGTHRHEPATVTVQNGLPSAAYHTYAAEWEPGAIRWYVDGQLTYTRTSATTGWLDSAFNKPFYLRLNLAVGGGWPGSPTDATVLPASFDVDYVRVYQR